MEVNGAMSVKPFGSTPIGTPQIARSNYRAHDKIEGLCSITIWQIHLPGLQFFQHFRRGYRDSH
jgi:hypothetical protein